MPTTIINIRYAITGIPQLLALPHYKEITLRGIRGTATIEATDDGVRLTAHEASRNGRPLESGVPSLIKSGDEITISSTTFVVESIDRLDPIVVEFAFKSSTRRAVWLPPTDTQTDFVQIERAARDALGHLTWVPDPELQGHQQVVCAVLKGAWDENAKLRTSLHDREVELDRVLVRLADIETERDVAVKLTERRVAELAGILGIKGASWPDCLDRVVANRAEATLVQQVSDARDAALKQAEAEHDEREGLALRVAELEGLLSASDEVVADAERDADQLRDRVRQGREVDRQRADAFGEALGMGPGWPWSSLANRAKTLTAVLRNLISVGKPPEGCEVDAYGDLSGGDNHLSRSSIFAGKVYVEGVNDDGQATSTYVPMSWILHFADVERARQAQATLGESSATTRDRDWQAVGTQSVAQGFVDTCAEHSWDPAQEPSPEPKPTDPRTKLAVRSCKHCAHSRSEHIGDDEWCPGQDVDGPGEAWVDATHYEPRRPCGDATNTEDDEPEDIHRVCERECFHVADGDGLGCEGVCRKLYPATPAPGVS